MKLTDTTTTVVNNTSLKNLARQINKIQVLLLEKGKNNGSICFISSNRCCYNVFIGMVVTIDMEIVKRWRAMKKEMNLCEVDENDT